MHRVSDLGEIDLIARIERRFRRIGPRPQAGIGEDAALLRPAAGVDWAISADQFHQGIHFRTAWSPADCIGWKGLAVNLSDLAAMGARPVAWFLLLGLPGRTRLDEFDALLDGCAAMARRYRIPLAGGDTAATRRLSMGITIVGELPRGRGLRRSTARPGDRLFVSGPLGAAALGLRLLRAGWRWRRGEAVPPLGRRFDRLRKRAAGRALAAHLRPDPPVEAAQRLVRDRLAGAGIDLSDGLGLDLHRLCDASGVGAEVETAALPAAGCLGAWTGAADRQRLVLGGGEDYEILIAVRSRRVAAVESLRIGRRRFHPIGRIVPRRAGIRLRQPDGGLLPLPASGFRHFTP